MNNRERAAQLWCLPQHSHKVMDPDLCESITAVLDAVREEALDEAARYLDEYGCQMFLFAGDSVSMVHAATAISAFAFRVRALKGKVE